MEPLNPPSPVKGETPEMFKAFCIYVEMGSDRSLAKVAKHIGISTSTLDKWCQKFHWRKRLLSFQEEANAIGEEKLKQRFFENVEQMKTFKNVIFEKLKKKFEDAHYCGVCKQHKLSVGDMIDILNVVKTELGEPTNITKQTAPNPDNDPFQLLLNRMYPPSSTITISPHVDAKAQL